jgi:hypothetical protein
MPRTQRVAQYIQRLAYESFFQRVERDERPDDAPRAPEPTPDYAAWNATSYSAYVPFRSPTSG